MTAPNRATPAVARDAARAEDDGTSAEAASAPAEAPSAPPEAPAEAVATPAGASTAPSEASATAGAAPAGAPVSTEAGPAEAGETPAQPEATTPVPTPPRRAARGLAVLRHHWLFSALLAAGLVLRVLVQAGYQPALIYVDTLKYLYGASTGSEPLGYTAILRVVLTVGNLSTVAGLQHLLGLAMAVVLYAVLLRRGAPR